MKNWLDINWSGMFLPTESLLDIAIRGTLIYVFLFFLLRFFPKRQTGGIGISDLLVIVLIADAAQNGMAGQYKSVTEGACLVFTIAFWDYAIDWLAYKIPAFERFTRPAPILLIQDGSTLPRNMAREKLSMDELMSQLRQHGIEQISEVKRAYRATAA